MEVLSIDTKFGSFSCLPNDLITKQIKNYGAHSRSELLMVLAFINSDDVVIDAGGHIGTFAIPISKKLNQDGYLVVIEPNKTNFGLLEENFRKNVHATNLNLVNKLLAAPGEYAEKKLDGNTGGGIFIKVEKSEVSGTSPETISLAEVTRDIKLVEENQKRSIFIKFDIEGAEYDALRDNEVFFDDYSPLIYSEINKESLAEFSASPNDIEMFLRKRGYRFFRNFYPRNTRNDIFFMKEIHTLTDNFEPLFDVLAIPENSKYLSLIKDFGNREILVTDFLNNVYEEVVLEKNIAEDIREIYLQETAIRRRNVKLYDLSIQLERRTDEKENLVIQLERRTEEKESLAIQLKSEKKEKESLVNQLDAIKVENEKLKMSVKNSFIFLIKRILMKLRISKNL